MEETQIETLDADAQFSAPSKKPVFLKVLCILSFISGGFMILFSGLALIFEGSFIGLIEELIDMARTDVEEITFQHLIDNYHFSMMLTLIGYMVSVVAVFLMKKLNKIGFFLYAVMHLLLVILPLVMVEIPEEIDSGIFGVVLGFLPTIAFIVMYGLNLKHMKR